MAKPEICFVYFHVEGLWNPRQVREDFADIRACGGDWIFTQFYEDNPNKTLKFKIDLAHEAGLKVLASPGRVAGLFAAGPRPCSIYTIRNMDALVREKDGSTEVANSTLVACVNHPKFSEWFYPAMLDTLRATGADGIVYDEPKETHKACYCKYCKDMVAEPTDEALLRLKEESVAKMMGKLCALHKQENPASVGVAMLMPSTTDNVIKATAEQPAIDFVGSDGLMCPQGPEGLNDKPLNPQKTSLAESAQRFARIVRPAGKKVLGLAETFGMRKWTHKHLREGIKTLPGLNLDMYCFNYYAHNVEDPDGLMEIIRTASMNLKS